jgi:histone-lysine N-methyltransferase SETD3
LSEPAPDRLFANTLLKDYLTYDEYRWAVSTVMTRQNIVPGPEDTPLHSLIPFWDLANHDHGQLSTDFDPETASTVCLAQRDFTEGEQFTIFYGVRANCDLLIHNGFVFPDNQADCLTVRLGVAKTDSLAAARLALLERLGVHSQKFHLRRTAEPIDGSLIAFLRVLQMDARMLGEHMAEGDEEVLRLCGAEDGPLDAKVMQWMITRAALLLRSYPSTLEQDQARQREEGVGPLELLTAQLLVAEKRILVGTVAYCEQRLQALQPAAGAKE